MLTTLTIFSYLVLLFIALFGKPKSRFTAIFAGLLFFPHVVAFRNSPYISPHTLLLYLPLWVEYFREPQKFKKALVKFPLKYPLLLFILTCSLTAAHTSGSIVKNFYDMFRYAFDTYAFLFLAYWFGLNLAIKDLLKAFLVPLILFISFGFTEFLMGENYPYRIICSAFPVYQGLYDLSHAICLSQDWRTRICITAHHPNTLVPMLMSLIFLLLPIFKEAGTKIRLVFCGLFALVFIAGSRTGILCTCALILLYFARKLSAITKIVIGFFVIILLPFYIYIFVDYVNSGKGSSIDMRQEQLLFALALFARDPIWGNGTGYMADNIFEVDTYGDKKLVDSSIGALESFLFRLLIDYGLIGLFAQVVLIGGLCLFFYRRRKKTPAAISGLLITMSTYIFVFLAGDSVGTFRFTFLIIGLCLGNCCIQNQEENKEENSYLESDGNKDNNLSEEKPSLN